MRQVFQRPLLLEDVPMHYCPGCGHGVVHRLIAQCMAELDIGPRCIGVSPVGCAVYVMDYINCDFQQAAHGRAPAVATGIKRVLPDRVVFTYQGDGDLAAIGTAEVVHAAARGEKITCFFVNNAVYGMTGGQMAPTTLVGQKTTTSPGGRDPGTFGYPVKICEMLAVLDGTAYVARASVTSPKDVIQAKEFIKKAFQAQLERAGFALVEILSPCPTNLGLRGPEGLAWVEREMKPVFPTGEFKSWRRS